MATRKKAAQSPNGSAGFVWLLVLLMFIGEMFFYAWCRVQCVQIGIAISQENHKQHELSTRQNSLNIELARLKSPENISRIARQKLDMQLPEPQQIVMVP